MHLAFTKALSLHNLPDDPEVLSAGIKRMCEALVLRRDKVLIRLPERLTGEEYRALLLRIAPDWPALAHDFFSSHSSRATLSTLRRKIWMNLGISIPRHRVVMDAKDVTMIRKLLDEAFEEQNDYGAVAQIMDCDPPTFSRTSSELTVCELKQRALQLIEFARGSYREISLANMTASERIILGALLAKTKGPVTKERLAIALQPPFCHHPYSVKNLPALVSELRTRLAPFHIGITNHELCGWTLDPRSRENLILLLAEPARFATPARQVPPAQILSVCVPG